VGNKKRPINLKQYKDHVQNIIILNIFNRHK